MLEFNIVGWRILVSSISRLVPVVAGIANYKNPFAIFWRRVLTHGGVMTLVDRETGVSVLAMRRSYHMFGATWYKGDYDVAACPLRAGDVVVDVGANQGFFTCYAAQRGARVYAYEPNPRAFDLLERNISSNGFSGLVRAKCVAVADFEGRADLLCSTFLDGGVDTIFPEHAEAMSSFGLRTGMVNVAVSRLESLIPGDASVRLLKLDCEGAELAILRGLKNPERFDSMAIEFHPDAYPVESLVRTILDFGTHQVYALHGQIIHAIRTAILIDFAQHAGSAKYNVA